MGTFVKAELPIILFGDAANAMTPHIAGSMSTGIFGAATFITQWNARLRDSGSHISTILSEVSKAYEFEHKPTAQKLMDLSLEQGGRWSGGITDTRSLLEHPTYLMHCADHLHLSDGQESS